MAQKTKLLSVTIATAGTRQRVVAIDSQYRYVKTATFIAPHSNTGNIFLGDATVSSTLYAARLTVDQETVYSADEMSIHPGAEENTLDLYNTWADASVSGESVLIAVQERA